MKLHFFLLILSAFQLCQSYKFLVYNPKFGRSQVMFMGKIADILAQNNHRVVNYVSDISSSFNDTGSKVAETWFRERKYKSDYNIATFHTSAWLTDWSYISMYKLFSAIGEEFRVSCEDQLKDTAFLERLKKENFDVGLSEYFDVCGFQIFKKIGVKKHILVYSSAVPQTDAAMFGVPATPSITPNIAYGYTPDMTFYERVQNFLSYWVNHFVMLEVLKGEPAKAYKNVFGVDFDYQQAFAESQYVFVNTDEHLDFPQIITQKRVHIGGLGMQNNDLTVELPQEMAQKIKEFKQGFVLVSFGTVASSYSMPEHVKTAFKEAFQMFPEVLFVMKYEKDDEYAKGVKNIYKVKWLPQRSLLNHPKVLAFITHSGMNSVTEATNAGVPMVNVPLFADQMYNSAMAISKGVGYRLDKFKITKNTVVEALRTVIQDESYKKRSKELSRMIRAKPMSPDERIQKYSEFAAEFNIADNLDIYGRDFSAFKFYSIDIMLFLSTFTMIVLYSIVKILKVVLRLCCSRKDKEE